MMETLLPECWSLMLTFATASDLETMRKVCKVGASYAKKLLGGRVLVVSDKATIYDVQQQSLVYLAHDDRGGASPDGRRIITINATEVQVWCARTGGLIGKLGANDNDVFAWAPDSRRIALTWEYLRDDDCDDGCFVDIYCVDSGAKVGVLCVPEQSIFHLGFSPDNKEILTIGYSSEDHPRRLRVWNLQTKTERLRLDHDFCTHGIFSPDGNLIVTGDDSIILWNVNDGSRRATLPGGGPITSLHFSPCGRRLAATHVTTSLSIWDLDTYTRQLDLPDAAWTADCSFSPDGRRIVSAGRYAAYVWDAHTGALLAKLGVDDPHPYCCQFITTTTTAHDDDDDERESSW